MKGAEIAIAIFTAVLIFSSTPFFLVAWIATDFDKAYKIFEDISTLLIND